MANTKKKSSRKNAVPSQITGLETAIAEVRGSRKISPRTTRLIAPGLPRLAQKVAEEATEVVIEAVRGRRIAVVKESVDLIYNLAVLWSELGITASEVWAEMDRRQALLGMSEKLPKDSEETAVLVKSQCSAVVRIRIGGRDLRPSPGSSAALDSAAFVGKNRRLCIGFGLKVGKTNATNQSAETDVAGRISKIGDGGVRTALYEAANVSLTRPGKGSTLKSWGMRLAARAGM